ncbi:MAG: class II fructose-bisphosphate aldolase [Anaerolineae bacterium]|nr:class II fructose-bisphosphate aldolase [Anaerolineae bacterium]
MPIISEPGAVAALYNRAGERGMCLANFCTANLYTTEAILKAAHDFGQAHGLKQVPVVVSATANYAVEAQLISYSAAQDARVGMKALLDDVAVLVAPGGPYDDLQVMLHFDHGQPDVDEAMFDEAAGVYATIMYDASAWPMRQNIEMTRAFVERMRGRVLVEGAVAEIAQAEDHADVPLTTPEDAERFYRETGVFLIVPDLGTEHRATATAARYDGARAQAITGRIGRRIVLHGSSSLPDGDLARLAGDGIVKVNVWTTFERVGGQAVARYVLRELAHILPAEDVRALQVEGWVGPRVIEGIEAGAAPRLESLREEGRRAVWQQAVIARMTFFLEQYGYARWGR